MTRKLFYLLLIPVIILGVLLWSPQKNVNASQVDRKTKLELQAYLHDHHINGIILVNGKKDQPVVLRNKLTTNPAQVVTPNALFPIGSLQKLITGVAVYQLVQKGELKWSTPLSKYYPQIQGSDQITLQQLMTHTSGLQNDGALPKKTLNNEQSQERFFLHHFKNTANHDWNYQDIDFEILGAIIRQRTHGGYYHYIKKTILKPLNHHQLKMVYQVKPRKVLQTMQPWMTWQMLSQAASSEIGAGDLLLSPLNYWNFIYHGVLSKPKLIKNFANQPKSQREAYFGGIYFQGTVIRANGSEPGYNCCFFADYKTKRTLMLFTNNIDYQTLRQTAEELYEIYYGEQIQP